MKNNYALNLYTIKKTIIMSTAKHMRSWHYLEKTV